MPSPTSILIVGGGLVGLATAYKALLRWPDADVTLLEKEADVGRHQSTHNSGVLHAGLHYAPGSLKARLARDGLRQMIEFCQHHGIAHEQCGKLVVAVDETEAGRLRDLLARGTANGLQGLRWLGGAAMLDVEPHVAGVAGVHVPEEGIVDYAAVCRALRDEVVRLGGRVRCGARVTSLRLESGAWHGETTTGPATGHLLINCAGLHSDRVARMSGERPAVRVVPFRGEYWTLREDRTAYVRNLVYPVPDPNFPFLGVHFTRMIHGGVEAGPNAVLALSREGYRWGIVSPRDVVDALSFPGLWRFLARYPRVATYEVARSLSRGRFAASLRRLIPAVQTEDLVPGPSGVRAQVMQPNGDLVHDFVIMENRRAVHVVNAPSPAATACLAIADEVIRKAAHVA